MRTIFIYMLLDDLKIKICNDALSYIHRNDDYVRESTLDDYLEKIYKEQYSRKMSYTILDTILIKRYQLIERIGNNITLTHKGIEVACSTSTDGIKGYIEDLRQKVIDDKKIAKLKIRSTTAATIASVVGVISFFINITSGNNKIKYIFCFIRAFILGVLLSDPAKNLVKRLLKEE